ncbi:MAG: DMT family transporter [Acidobacteria bacterium]|nr:DMT family transporter [Acidobacteriota bacterium]
MGKNLVKGLTYGVLSALFGAYPYIFFHVALENNAMTTAFFCLAYHLFAAVYLLGYLSARRQFHDLKVPRALRPGILLMGGLEFLSVWSLFSAMRIMDPTLVSFFNNSQTLFIILLGALILGERFNATESLGTLVALSGVVMISYKSGAPVKIGMLLTVTSALLFSCTVILVKKKLEAVSPLALAFYRALTITACFGVVCGVGGMRMPAEAGLLAPIAAGALFGPFLNILFYFGALKHLDASKTSLIRSVLPVFVLVNAMVFLHMVPLPMQLVGGCIIIVGLWILVTGREQAETTRTGA